MNDELSTDVDEDASDFEFVVENHPKRLKLSDLTELAIPMGSVNW